jgi:predicted HTH domain antitoxin
MLPTMVHGQTICQTEYGLITSLKYCHIFLPVPIKVLKDPDLLVSVIVFYELMNTVLLKRQKNHVRVTIWKTLMYDCIISLRVEVMAHKTSLTLMLFIEYQERRVIIYVHLYQERRVIIYVHLYQERRVIIYVHLYQERRVIIYVHLYQERRVIIYVHLYQERRVIIYVHLYQERRVIIYVHLYQERRVIIYVHLYQERRVIIYVHLYRFYLCFHYFLGTVWIVWYFMCSSLLPV